MHTHTTRTPSQIKAELDRVQSEEARADRKVGRWLTERSSLRAQIPRLEAELQAAQTPPEILTGYARFQKRYATGPRTYSFVAVRAAGAWWVSGAQSPQGLLWKELVAFARRDNVLPAEQRDPKPLYVEQDLPSF